MSEPTIELQRAVRACLVGAPAVVAIVPATSIVDAARRPEKFPSIVFGAAQIVAEDLTTSRQHVRVFLDLHVWTREGGTIAAAEIVGALTTALRSPLTLRDMTLVDFHHAGTRYLRDPSSDHGHAVVSLEALIGFRL